MHAAVIGGAGFLGSHLVDRLLLDGGVVDVLDDLSTGSLANLAAARAAGGGLKFHHVDVASAEGLSLFGMRRPDVVFHLAALPRRWTSPRELTAAFDRTVALVDAARQYGVSKVVVAVPATAVYDRPAARDLPVKERALEPRGLRGIVARATVDLLAHHREEYALESTVLACANVYGPRQRPGDGVVASFVDARRRGAAPVLAGDGRQTRDFVHVDDVVDALHRAASRGGGLVVNIGTGVQTPVRELWTMLGGSVEPVIGAPRAEELQRFAVSPVRARIHLGWSPWTPLAEGLDELLAAD